jgi:hypothetical protein
MESYESNGVLTSFQNVPNYSLVTALCLYMSELFPLHKSWRVCGSVTQTYSPPRQNFPSRKLELWGSIVCRSAWNWVHSVEKDDLVSRAATRTNSSASKETTKSLDQKTNHESCEPRRLRISLFLSHAPMSFAGCGSHGAWSITAKFLGVTN